VSGACLVFRGFLLLDWLQEIGLADALEVVSPRNIALLYENSLVLTVISDTFEEDSAAQ
jgi:hypothetical protein